mmetsp:Transcript_80583/g.184579  ORF Transcript_80583/g.184579 Transcript_80583/m.184579 type:complete len:441 (+) Transcript_80583:2409-3731(+)
MHLTPIVQHFVLPLQFLHNVLVGRLHVLAVEVRHVRPKHPGVVNGAHHAVPVLVADPGLHAHPEIVLSEGGGGVDNTGPRVCGNEIPSDHLERRIPGLGLEVREKGLVTHPNQRAPQHFFQHRKLGRVFLNGLTDPIPTILAHNQHHSVRLPLDPQVLELGVDGQCQVGGQGPGGGRPHSETLVSRTHAGEQDDDGRVRHVLVVLGHLEIRQRRAARRRIRHHPERTVHHPLQEQLLEHPPPGLHEGRVHRLVVVVKIDPPTEPGDDLPPLPGVLGDDLLTLLVVLLDPDLRDIVLVFHPQLLVDDLLHGKPVAIPPKTPLDVVAGLVGIPGHHIFQGPGQDVPIMRQPGRKRRPVVERVRLPVLGLPQGRLEGVDLTPVLDDFLLLLGEIRPVGHLVEGVVGHGACELARPDAAAADRGGEAKCPDDCSHGVNGQQTSA